MKKIFLYLSLYCCHLCLNSCGNVPENGDLDGMWHLRTVETLSNNRTEDVKEERIYYSVQQNLITLRKYGYGQYIGRFTYTSDSLCLHDFVVYQREDKAATTEDLVPFKLEGTVSQYAIHTLNNKALVLRSKRFELTFKKF